MLAGIRTLLSGKGDQPKLPVQCHPTLSRPKRDARSSRDRVQWAVIFQVGLKETESL